MLSIISLIITLIALAGQYFTTISSMKERLTKLETKIELFWKTVEKAIPKLLMAPHSPRQDELLQKLSNGKLSKTEACELKGLLEEALKIKNPSKVVAIALLLSRLEQIERGLDK